MKIYEVSNLEELENCLAEAISNKSKIIIKNPSSSIFYLGSLYLKTLLESARNKFQNFDNYQFICDCADDSAIVQEALHLGFKIILFTGNNIVRAKLSEIARQYEAQIINKIEN